MQDPQGNAKFWLKLEGLTILILAAWIYFHAGHGGWWFLILFFTPDISCAGYLAGPRAGAAGYNLGHNWTLPALLAGLSLLLNQPALAAGSLIWAAHVGFDRASGFGLKSTEGFGVTNLGNMTFGLPIIEAIQPAGKKEMKGARTRRRAA